MNEFEQAMQEFRAVMRLYMVMHKDTDLTMGTKIVLVDSITEEAHDQLVRCWNRPQPARMRASGHGASRSSNSPRIQGTYLCCTGSCNPETIGFAGAPLPRSNGSSETPPVYRF